MKKNILLFIISLVLLSLMPYTIKAQNYKGIILGDIPAIMEIKSIKGKERGFIKIVGKKQGWSGLEIERDKGQLVLKREKESESANFPIVLNDVSQQYDLKKGSIYAGTMKIKAKEQGQQDYFKDVLFIIDSAK